MSIIDTQDKMYYERKLLNNYAAEYAKRECDSVKSELNTHISTAVLDHPNGSVTTSKLANGAVTSEKIGEDFKSELGLKLDSVTVNADRHKSAEVLDHPNGSVTTSKLADGAVTESKLADYSITSDKLSDALMESIDIAIDTAESANLNANSASETANTAKTTADSAISIADAAQTAANSSVIKADAAQTIANNALAKANSAQSSMGYGLDCLNRFNCSYYADHGVYINAKPDYVPMGTYLFMPEQSVPYMYITDAEDTMETAVVDYEFKKGYMYLVKLVEGDSTRSTVLAEFTSAESVNEVIGELSEINLGLYDTVVDALNGITTELDTKEDAELVWTKLHTTTLTEDVDSFSYTLSDNCYGVIVQVQVPADVSYGQGYIRAVSESTGWVGAVYSSGLSTTNNEKEIRLVVYPQNGYYQSYSVIKNGTNNTTWTRYEPSTTHFMSTKKNKIIDTISTTSALYTGSTITIWGLINI